jgi:hypothetical protein
MGDKSQDTGASGDQDQDQGATLSNADVKAHPLFKKLTSELAAERKSSKEDRARLEALEKAENERQTKAAEKKGDYEKATQKRIDEAVNDARKQWEVEQSVNDKKAEAKLQLVKSGFKNEKFLRGALADFDPEKHTAEDFVKAIAEDESNKPFLDTGKGTTGGKPDPHPTPRSGSKLLTPAEIQALRESGKPEDIARANDAAEALWVAEGTTGLPT